MASLSVFTFEQRCVAGETNDYVCVFYLKTELGANPLDNGGIELGAFNGLSALYVGIAEAKLTAVPKGGAQTAVLRNRTHSLSHRISLSSMEQLKEMQRFSRLDTFVFFPFTNLVCLVFFSRPSNLHDRADLRLQQNI